MNAVDFFIKLLGGLIGLEQDFGAPQALLLQSEKFVTWKLIHTIDFIVLLCTLHLCIKIDGNYTHALFDLADSLHCCS